MKVIKSLVIILFFTILITPMLFFNFQENYKSEIDNRMLANNPFNNISEIKNPAELGSRLSSYINDRIGFRNEAISSYNLINNNLFRIMEHPYYMKGQDGYIFIRKSSNVIFSDYHRKFAENIVEISNYCKARSVPFIFVFEPEKLSVMREFAPVGMNYDNSWVDEFLEILDKNGVSYVNNTEILTEKYKANENVFNKQYDAGHWNDIGAFYGVNYILEKMKEYYPDIHINTTDEFNISKKHMVDLQQNGVLVEEDVPYYTLKNKPKELTESYKEEVVLHPDYHYFYYTKNSAVESPKTLMFQGSYMNTRGYKFMSNALEEYIAVHDYQNIFDFEYYYNLFKPECVIFEVAEYTFSDLYFDSERFETFRLNPVLESFDDYKTVEKNISEIAVTISEGSRITDISISNLPEGTAYAVIDDTIYDLKKGDDGFTLSLLKSDFDADDITVISVDESDKIKYIYKKQ